MDIVTHTRKRLERLIRPILERVAREVTAGDTFDHDAPLLAISAVLARLDHHHVTTPEKLYVLLPVKGHAGHPGLPAEKIRDILAARKGGASVNSIAKSARTTATTVRSVLKREGDPAPPTVRAARDKAIQRRRDTALATTARMLGRTVAELLEMQRTAPRPGA